MVMVLFYDLCDVVLYSFRSLLFVLLFALFVCSFYERRIVYCFALALAHAITLKPNCASGIEEDCGHAFALGDSARKICVDTSIYQLYLPLPLLKL